MNEEPPAESPPRRGFRFGCLTRVVLAAAAAVALVVLIGETFDQGPPANPPARTLDAGVAEEYARGDVSFFPRFYWIVRLDDGSFLAFYNKSSKAQEVGRDCRVNFDESAQLTGLPQLPGFTGAFVEECGELRATWRADGEFAGGAGYGNLDRFETEVNAAGHLIVKIDSRTCTRSRGVAGQPPFDVTTCGRGD
jgi:hypothetical protein